MNKKLIGAGSIIEPFVFIGHNVEVSQGLLIQEKSSIEHNSVIGCGVTINPGSIINGNCHLMKYVYIEKKNGLNVLYMNVYTLSDSISLKHTQEIMIYMHQKY